MPKRVTYLEKREGMPREDFCAYWSTTHADIARDLPGVAGYRQNHIKPLPVIPPGADAFAVDGIVELWFTDESVVHAGFESDVARRLADDEPNFLSGLTGGPVSAPDAHEPCAGKLWVLGLWRQNDSGASRQAVSTWAEDVVSGLPGAINATANFLDPGAPLLTRQALRSEPHIPEVALSFGLHAGISAPAAGSHLLENLGSIQDLLRRVHVYYAEEVVIL
ncbi:EthD domain-containing protein [Pseudarthrobacter sp. NPDC089323]